MVLHWTSSKKIVQVEYYDRVIYAPLYVRTVEERLIGECEKPKYLVNYLKFSKENSICFDICSEFVLLNSTNCLVYRC